MVWIGSGKKCQFYKKGEWKMKKEKGSSIMNTMNATKDDPNHTRHIITSIFYPVNPSYIKINGNMVEIVDGCNGVNESAGIIVAFCQKKGWWSPFTENDLKQFIEEDLLQRWNNFFEGSYNPIKILSKAYSYYIIFKDKKWHITHEFVCDCWQYCPNN